MDEEIHVTRCNTPNRIHQHQQETHSIAPWGPADFSPSARQLFPSPFTGRRKSRHGSCMPVDTDCNEPWIPRDKLTSATYSWHTAQKVCLVTEKAVSWWTAHFWNTKLIYTMMRSQVSISSKAAKLENRQIHKTGNTIKVSLALSQPKAAQGTLPCTSLLLIVLNQVWPGALLFLGGRGPSLKFSGGCHRQTYRHSAV